MVQQTQRNERERAWMAAAEAALLEARRQETEREKKQREDSDMIRLAGAPLAARRPPEAIGAGVVRSPSMMAAGIGINALRPAPQMHASWYFPKRLSFQRVTVSQLERLPVRFDRGDRYIEFSANADDVGGTARTWDQLALAGDATYYRPLFITAHRRFDPPVSHSEVALNLHFVEASGDALAESYHRPRLTVALEKPLNVHVLPVPRADPTAPSQLDKAEELSLTTGSAVLMEHLTTPGMVADAGMASCCFCFWHRDVQSGQAPSGVHVLEPEDPSPFFARIPRGKPIWGWIGTLSRSVIAPQEGHKEFLMILARDGSARLVRIDRFFAVGTTEPLEEGLVPVSTPAKLVEEECIRSLMINVFRGGPFMGPKRESIPLDLPERLFTQMAAGRARRVTSRVAVSRDGSWHPRFLDADAAFQKIAVSPEKAVAYESMIAGLSVLRHDVFLFTQPVRMFRAVRRVQGAVSRVIAERVERAVNRTPWARAANFRGMFERRRMEVVADGDGDMLARRGRATAQKEKIGHYRTGHDLRALHITDLMRQLMGLGVRESDIPRNRWQAVAMLKRLASQEGSGLEQFARDERTTGQIAREECVARYENSFNNSLGLITQAAAATGRADEDALGDFDFNAGDAPGSTEEEDESDNAQPTQGLKQETDTRDPPWMRPFDPAVSRTIIDWDALGFAGVQRRTIYKLIITRLRPQFEPVTTVEWVRNSAKVDELEKRSSDVWTGRSDEMMGQSLDEMVLLERQQQISKRLRDLRRIQHLQKPERVDHLHFRIGSELMIVRESGHELTINLSPDSIARIDAASKRFAVVQQPRRRRPRQKVRESSESEPSGTDDDDERIESEWPEKVRGTRRKATKRKEVPTRDNPVMQFNKALMELAEQFQDSAKGSALFEPLINRCREGFYSDLEQFLEAARDLGSKFFEKLERAVRASTVLAALEPKQTSSVKRTKRRKVRKERE
jgi:hypothetical protein